MTTGLKMKSPNLACCKIHFTSNSCVLLYWQPYRTTLQQRASVKLCGVVQRMELRNFRRQRHLYSSMDRAAITLDKERNLGNLDIRRDHPASSDRSEILRGGWSSRDSSKIQISSKSVKRFRAIMGRNAAIRNDLAIGLYNSLDYRTSRNIIIGTSGRPRLESATEL